jgi:cell division protein FtsW (lipid II flippase)
MVQVLPDAHTAFVSRVAAEPLGVALGVMLVSALAFAAYRVFRT